MSIRQRARSLRAQIDAVVDADWSHGGWWLLTWLTAILARFGSPHRAVDQTRYHGANGGPHSDTFMARPRGWRDQGSIQVNESPPVWGARNALAGLRALDELEGQLPGQPLHVTLTWEGGWLNVEPLPAAASRHVVFTVRGSHYLAEAGAMTEKALADGLAALTRVGHLPPGFRNVPAVGPVPAALAVSLDVDHHDTARHIHRRSWNSSGGPWLGIGRTPALEMVTTCHVVVDGLGHALLTDRILRPSTGEAVGHLTNPAPRRPRLPRSPTRDLQTGLAWAYLPAGAGRFAEQAYATGVVLEDFFGAGGHARGLRNYSPPFTVPVAPGSSNDPTRRLGRVVHGILSVRRHPSAVHGACGSEGFEPFEAFTQRLGPWLETERAGQGILARISSAVSRGPLPRALKHLALTNHHGPRSSIPSVEGLSGRARLSSIRFPESIRAKGVAPPMIAASVPTLLPNKDDDRGGVVVTLIHHDEGTTVTVFGTGKTAEGAAAQDFLERWLHTLDQLRKG